MIDEVSQAVECSVIIPLVHGAERLILVGDQQQLPPYINNFAERYNYI